MLLRAMDNGAQYYYLKMQALLRFSGKNILFLLYSPVIRYYGLTVIITFAFLIKSYKHSTQGFEQVFCGKVLHFTNFDNLFSSCIDSRLPIFLLFS